MAAGGVASNPWTAQLVAIAALVIASAGALWWVYFARAKPALDRAFEQTRGAAQSTLARDAYSLLHFPVLFGLITFAVAIGEAIAHAADPLRFSTRAGLAAGMMLYLAGMALCLRRANVAWTHARIGLAILLALLILAVPGSSPVVTFMILLLGLTTLAMIEQRLRVTG